MGGKRRGFGKCETCSKYSSECERKRIEDEKKGVLNYHGVNETLCWCCAHAVPHRDKNTGAEYGCEWSMYFQKVPGWDAEPCDLRVNETESVPSYIVKNCPKFVRG